MPGKARRVASRQAQLNQRRKKQQRGPRGIPVAQPVASPEDGQADLSVATQEPELAAPTPASSPSAQPSPAAGRTGPATRSLNPSRARREYTTSTNYIGAELRRILVMAGVVLVVLVALTFVVP